MKKIVQFWNNKKSIFRLIFFCIIVFMCETYIIILLTILIFISIYRLESQGQDYENN